MIWAMDHAKTIGRALQSLRLNLDLSRAQLAAKTKLPISAVYRHETGRRPPTTDELMRYLRALRCTAVEFDRVREDLAKFRDRTDNFWHQTDIAAPEDGVAELSDDLARIIRRITGEMIKKVTEHQ